MADQSDVRQIAMSLPGAIAAEDTFAFSVLVKGKQKGFAWVWNERVEPKKPKVPNPDVVALRVKNDDEKQMLLAMNTETMFTEPHYNGFPAVLVRLSASSVEELREWVSDAWNCVSNPQKRSV